MWFRMDVFSAGAVIELELLSYWDVNNTVVSLCNSTSSRPIKGISLLPRAKAQLLQHDHQWSAKYVQELGQMHLVLKLRKNIHCCNECHTVHKWQSSFPSASRWWESGLFPIKLDDHKTIRQLYMSFYLWNRPSLETQDAGCGSWSGLKTFHARARHLQLMYQRFLVWSIVYLLYDSLWLLVV